MHTPGEAAVSLQEFIAFLLTCVWSGVDIRLSHGRGLEAACMSGAEAWVDAPAAGLAPRAVRKTEMALPVLIGNCLSGGDS